MLNNQETIAAPATAPGGALCVIRVSGDDAISICDKIFSSHKGRQLSDLKSHSIAYGNIINEASEIVDDVLVSVFRAPNSYTGENSVEISCHGSRYVTTEIMRLLINAGARAADAGEFTARAFLAGRIDLSQAEAVADMIASHDHATHRIASTQMRGGYSNDLMVLRNELLRLTSLLELELDFSEEDVTFADREELAGLMSAIADELDRLISSFTLGNAIKEGIPVAIIGSPNAGKSTLLNTLLKDDRAMVSDIPGTTRDIIEEQVNIGGIGFRFIDTAGIRHSDDVLEQMGIERTLKAVERAQIILYVFDISQDDASSDSILEKTSGLNLDDRQQLCIVLNKCDKNQELSAPDRLKHELESKSGDRTIPISAKLGHGIEELEMFMESSMDFSAIYSGQTVVSNSRHYEALLHSKDALERAVSAMRAGLSGDLLSQDIRDALHHLGTITGEITTDEILGEIFSKFCIGK